MIAQDLNISFNRSSGLHGVETFIEFTCNGTKFKFKLDQNQYISEDVPIINAKICIAHEEENVILLCGHIVDVCETLIRMHPFEMTDINFHLRAIQNMIYARATMRQGDSNTLNP